MGIATADLTDIAAYRRFFAAEIQAVANLRDSTLVDALATVPREAFLGPGPWVIRSEIDLGGPPRQTPDADARHVYHNVAIGIDPARMLFNGGPGVVAPCIDALAIRPGDRVLHVGCGLGYYSALIAQVTGSAGRVVAIEVDEALAADARDNLRRWTWVEARHGDGTDLRDESDKSFDAILVNAGTTHPHEAWLNALAPGGRLVVPITCTMAQMGPIGKGLMFLLSDTGQPDALEARVITTVAIYSALGVRDAALNDRLGRAFMRGGAFPGIKRLRRDRHDESPSCWLHTDAFCLASA